MKRTILAVFALALALSSASALAEWVRVHGNDKVVAYADPSTIRKRGNIARMWSLFDFKTENTLPDGNTYFSVMRETEFNCKDHLQHMVGYSIHSGNMSKGRVIEKGAEPQEWKPISQTNIAFSMWEFACTRE